MRQYDESMEVHLRMMNHVIRDEETDEITGLSPDAPPDEVEAFNKMMEEMNSLEPRVY